MGTIIDSTTCTATLETVADENEFTCTLGSARDGLEKSATLPQFDIKPKFTVTIDGGLIEGEQKTEGDKITLTCEGNHEVETCTFDDIVNGEQAASLVNGKTCQIEIELKVDHEGSQITCNLTEHGGEMATAEIELSVKSTTTTTTTTTTPPETSSVTDEITPEGKTGEGKRLSGEGVSLHSRSLAMGL